VPSGEYKTSATGTYYWVATFSGDANNKGASSGCAAEAVVTDPAATASIATTAQPTSGVVGSTFKDKATIAGLFGAPGGQMSWKLYSKNNCSGAVGSEGPVQVSANGEYITPAGVTPTKAGTYYWVATYSGDANNGAVSSACAAEPIVVHPSPPVGHAAAHGPTECVATKATVYVTGHEIKSVTFWLDGPKRKLGIVAHADRRGRFVMHILARDLRAHIHHVEIVVTFTARSRTAPRTMRVPVERCPPPRPVFTG